MSLGFSEQEYWSGLSFSSLVDLSNPGLKPESPVSPALQEDSLPLESLRMPSERNDYHHITLPILLVSLRAFLKSPRELGKSKGQDSGSCFSLRCPKKTTLGDEGPAPLLSPASANLNPIFVMLPTGSLKVKDWLVKGQRNRLSEVFQVSGDHGNYVL